MPERPQRFSSRLAEILRRTRPWLVVLSVVSFVSAALAAIVVVAGLLQLAQGRVAETGTFLTGLLGYAGLSIVAFASASVLWSYARRIREFLDTPSVRRLEEVHERARVYFTIMGIVSIVILGVALFGISVAVFFARVMSGA